MSGDLGNVCALSGELRNEPDLKRTGPLLIFATVNARIVSGDLRNRTGGFAAGLHKTRLSDDRPILTS